MDGTALVGIGIGLAVGLGAIGTGLAQKSIGPAVVGACAEDRKFLGLAILFLAIPETIIILSFAIGYLLLEKMK